MNHAKKDRASKLETQAITSHAAQGDDSAWSKAYAEAASSRERLLEKLDIEGRDDLTDRLQKCGEPIALICQGCGGRHEAHWRCNRKWCPTCQRALAAKASLRYTGITESFQWPLFVTWTTRNYDDCDRDFIAHMLTAHRAMRRQRWWRSRVRGGVLGMEVTNKGKGYHPHLHGVIDCKWLAVTQTPPPYHADKTTLARAYRRAKIELDEQWTMAMGQPSSCFLKRASARGNGKDKPIAMEVIKYSLTRESLDKIEGPIAPLLDLLDGSRLLTSFGSAHGHLCDYDAPPRPLACDTCGLAGTWTPLDPLLRRFTRDREKRRKR